MFADDGLMQQPLGSFGYIQPPHDIYKLLYRSEIFDFLF